MLNIGAGLGVYKNLIRKDTKTIHSNEKKNNPIDIHDQLIKFSDLKEKGILSESEFACQKSKLLKGDGRTEIYSVGVTLKKLASQTAHPCGAVSLTLTMGFLVTNLSSI